MRGDNHIFLKNGRKIFTKNRILQVALKYLMNLVVMNDGLIITIDLRQRVACRQYSEFTCAVGGTADGIGLRAGRECPEADLLPTTARPGH